MYATTKRKRKDCENDWGTFSFFKLIRIKLKKFNQLKQLIKKKITFSKKSNET
jgi:hypothetical protein